jgi:hypothetical protein
MLGQFGAVSTVLSVGIVWNVARFVCGMFGPM